MFYCEYWTRRLNCWNSTSHFRYPMANHQGNASLMTRYTHACTHSFAHPLILNTHLFIHSILARTLIIHSLNTHFTQYPFIHSLNAHSFIQYSFIHSILTHNSSFTIHSVNTRSHTLLAHLFIRSTLTRSLVRSLNTHTLSLLIHSFTIHTTLTRSFTQTALIRGC
jgi:hypothetical protein